MIDAAGFCGVPFQKCQAENHDINTAAQMLQLILNHIFSDPGSYEEQELAYLFK